MAQRHGAKKSIQEVAHSRPMVNGCVEGRGFAKKFFARTRTRTKFFEQTPPRAPAGL